MAKQKKEFEKIFHFTAHDVEINEDKRLTTRQRLILLWLLLKQDFDFRWFFLLVMIFAVPASLVNSGVLIVTSPFTLIVGWKMLKLGLDILGGRVHEANGKVYTHHHFYMNSGGFDSIPSTSRWSMKLHSYGMSIDNVGFRINRSIYDVFQDEKTYSVYYVPHSKIIVSVARWISHKE